MKMFAFRLAVSSDLPLGQLLVACLVGWLLSGGSKPSIVRDTPSSHEPESPNNELLT